MMLSNNFRCMLTAFLLAVVFLLPKESAYAIGKGDLEVGIDGAVSYSVFSSLSSSRGVYGFAAPSRVRIGSYVDDKILLEFFPSFSHFASDGSAVTIVDFGIGVGFHSISDNGKIARFVEPSFKLSGFFTNSGGLRQIFMGVEFGSKTLSSSGFGGKYSLFIEQAFRNSQLDSFTTIGFRFGLLFIKPKVERDPDFE